MFFAALLRRWDRMKNAGRSSLKGMEGEGRGWLGLEEAGGKELGEVGDIEKIATLLAN